MRSLVSKAGRVAVARPWISAAVVVIVGGGSVAAYLLVGSSSGAQAQSGGSTRLVAASLGTVRQSVSATGTFAPADEKDVSFSSSAEVTSVRVSVGDRVSAGQVLGTIDTVSLNASVADAESTLAQAKATLADAQDGDTATDEELAADRASVATAKNTVKAAKQALADATLRSPITGTVAEVNVAKGDMASGSSAGSSGSSGDSSGSAGGSGGSGGNRNGAAGGDSSSSSSGSSSSADFVVLGMKKWTVSASVDDTQVGLIKKGDQVQLTTDGASTPIFGTVASVSVLASTSSGSASYPVTVDVTGTPSGLHDGASATESIIYKQVTNVVTVPTLAIHRDGGSAYVYVASGGRKQKRTVTTGLVGTGTTQITSGLSAGQQVYVQVPGGSRSGASNGNRGGTGGRFPRGGGGGGGFQIPAGGNVQLPNGRLVQLPGTGGGK